MKPLQPPASTTAATWLRACRRRLRNANSHLLTGVVFTVPFSTAASNILAGVLLLCWLAQGEFRQSWREVRDNPLIWAASAFLLLHVLGLAWTEHGEEGWAALRKEWKFLMLPVFLVCARTEHRARYLAAFVAAMAIAVAVSFGIWLELLPLFNRATLDNPVPFATHVVYGPLLALAIYLLARWLLFDSGAGWRRAFALLLLVAMSVNMFITAGRAGQAAFFVAVVLLGLQYFGPSLRAAGAVLGVVVATLALAYAGSDSFRQRLTAALTGDANQGEYYDISIDERRAYTSNAWQVVAEHPWLGVGTGDLAAEMRRHHLANTPELRFRANPHNMYLMMAGRFGVVLGLGVLASLFAIQLRLAMTRPNPLFVRHAGVALPVMFAVLCIGESYLAVHATALLFCAFSGFLYKSKEDPAPMRTTAA